MNAETNHGPVTVTYRDGRTYVVTDAATAATAHPDATITGYEDGSPFVRARDASVVAQQEAEEAARAKAAKRTKPPVEEPAKDAESAKAEGE